MPDTLDKIKRLWRELYPRGRAFKMPPITGGATLPATLPATFTGVGGELTRLHNALAVSTAQAFDDAKATLDAAIADNANFTIDDATAWEARLGIASGTGVSLSDRMKAINQKLNYPGTNAPRQHYLFIESELQAAGFNVHVYENNFGGVTQTPEQVLGTGAGAAIHATTTQHKTTLQHGARYANLVANYVEQDKDATFAVGSHYRSTFYVAGATVATFVDVDIARKHEFRQLLLKLKPVNTVGFLFVNYV